MPLWPFVMLFVTFLAVMILPPLVAAYVDHLSELRRTGGRGSSDEARSDG